jgi:hypothetical protein
MKKMQFKFTERIPDILLESFFIVVALLLALALDQWRDEQKGLELAKSAKAAIYAELSDNKKKLEDKRIAHKEILKSINLYIKQVDAIESEAKELEFEYTMVLISDSAWNSAKMTQVVQSFNFKEITNFSQVYQMQALYLSNQDKIIDKVMQMGELKEEDILGFAKGLAHRLTILIDINENFCKGLERVIAEKNIG